MTPAALSLLAGLRPQGPDRDALLALYGTSISVGFVTGALAAGLLANVADWRPAMVLGVPLALTAIALAATATPGPPPRATRAPALALLRRPAVRRAATAGALVTATGVGGTLLLVTLLQDGRGHTPLETGLMLVLFGAAAPIGARAARSAGGPAALTAGLALQGAAFLALAALPPAAGLAPVLAAIAGFGLGHVAGNTGAAMAVVADLPAERHGAAAGVLATAQYLGGAAGPLASGAGFAAVGAAACAGALLLWLEAP
jgi:DHA2 family integral membrane protein (MFS transporter)